MAVRTTPVGTAVATQQAAAATMNGAAGGWIGYLDTVTAQTGITTAGADLTGLSVAVTVGTSRRLKITGYVFFRQQTASGNVTLRIRESGVTSNRISGTYVASETGGLFAIAVITPSSGAHTYNLHLTTSSNTVDTAPAADNAMFILVEDMGPA